MQNVTPLHRNRGSAPQPAGLNSVIARLFDEFDVIDVAAKEAHELLKDAYLHYQDAADKLNVATARHAQAQIDKEAKYSELGDRLAEFKDGCPKGKWIETFTSTFGKKRLRQAQRILKDRREGEEGRAARLQRETEAKAARRAAAKKKEAAKADAEAKAKTAAAASGATDTANVRRIGLDSSKPDDVPLTILAGPVPLPLVGINIDTLKAAILKLEPEQRRGLAAWIIDLDNPDPGQPHGDADMHEVASGALMISAAILGGAGRRSVIDKQDMPRPNDAAQSSSA